MHNCKLDKKRSKTHFHRDVKMNTAEGLIQRLDETDNQGDLKNALEATDRLWQYSSYEKEITKDQLRNSYIDSFLKFLILLSLNRRVSLACLFLR